MNQKAVYKKFKVLFFFFLFESFATLWLMNEGTSEWRVAIP